ncbi:MAG TPA: penicillin-binding protein activator [Geminicoccus sp.]|uniref:penicillin-binding protein activator n=1 Tax=Geminicoccus sp. TaxID=2024832 RepID=UPI002E3059B6|nr:penicillin-binding protein activator [Geminicoccus sp.]HEX2524961.1 penicillin-binding protein activator [Geminicoccus sp.]
MRPVLRLEVIVVMRPAKTITPAATILLAVIMLVAACAPQRQVPWRPTQPTAPVTPPAMAMQPKAALLLPLTGPAAAVGQDLLDAAQMALFDAGDNQLELMPFDTGSEPDGATVAARAAIASGANVIIGPLFGRSTVAVTPLATSAGVEVFSLSNDSSVARPGIWVMGFGPEQQVDRVVRFAAQTGVNRMAALAPADAFGTRAIQAFQRAVGATGTARIVDIATYDASNSTPTDAVGRVATGLGVGPATEGGALSAPDSAVLIADGGARLRAVASLLAYHDIDPRSVRHLGTSRIQDDAAALLDPQLQGTWFAGAPPEGAEEFATRFRSLFNRSPSSVALLAYDTTAMVAGQSRAGPLDPAAFLDSQGFVGRAGIFRLLPDGRTERGLAVLEVNQGTAQVVDPAPLTFREQFAAR